MLAGATFSSREDLLAATAAASWGDDTSNNNNNNETAANDTSNKTTDTELLRAEIKAEVLRDLEIERQRINATTFASSYESPTAAAAEVRNQGSPAPSLPGILLSASPPQTGKQQLEPWDYMDMMDSPDSVLSSRSHHHQPPPAVHYGQVLPFPYPASPLAAYVGNQHLPNGALQNVVLSHVIQSGGNAAAHPGHLHGAPLPPQATDHFHLGHPPGLAPSHLLPLQPQHPPEEAAKAPKERKPPKKAPRKAKAVKDNGGGGGRKERGTSKFRGVSRHRLTGRWEASCWVQKRQLYLGGFDSEEKAARAYDVAALVCKGLDAQINFQLGDYLHHIQMLRHCTHDELVAHIRRQSAAFSRGKSKFRGVSGQEKRWEARIGQYEGKKNVSFGAYENEEEAARQYDRALIIQRGKSAKTNFNVFLYQTEIMEYEKFVSELPPAKQAEARRTTTLPFGRKPQQTGKRGTSAALIFAEEVKKALHFGE